jgi:hypothetical protein
VFRPVDVGAEGDSLLGDFPQLRQGHHLEAAGIGQDRAVPPHEAVQAALFADPFRAGAQHQVIGVAEDDLRAGGGDRIRQHRLHRGGRADRHEGRGLDRAVGGGQASAPRRAVAGQDRKTEIAHPWFRSGSRRLASP